MVATHPHQRILVVEDNFSARELMSLLLGGVGYMVCTASNGAEAMQKLHAFERPDLILLDLRMPVMDGWEFRERLQQDAALADIPVVVLSGVDEVGVRATCLEGDRFLHKPVDTAELLHIIQQCCGGAAAGRGAGGPAPVAPQA